ncbi:hypothetical protein COV19_05285 [Candidatus Woesearchaeota archaeon CG10_big_fil_rev_8_21_14_0_10_44_13]|nr:MAG: hypothetical protein COV19_05285 [Candidatus Woesearchaeota archaeon CG10_big_fil_rev_8_21_14_0_10_44_13]
MNLEQAIAAAERKYPEETAVKIKGMMEQMARIMPLLNEHCKEKTSVLGQSLDTILSYQGDNALIVANYFNNWIHTSSEQATVPIEKKIRMLAEYIGLMNRIFSSESVLRLADMDDKKKAAAFINFIGYAAYRTGDEGFTGLVEDFLNGQTTEKIFNLYSDEAAKKIFSVALDMLIDDIRFGHFSMNGPHSDEKNPSFRRLSNILRLFLLGETRDTVRYYEQEFGSDSEEFKDIISLMSYMTYRKHDKNSINAISDIIYKHKETFTALSDRFIGKYLVMCDELYKCPGSPAEYEEGAHTAKTAIRLVKSFYNADPEHIGRLLNVVIKSSRGLRDFIVHMRRNFSNSTICSNLGNLEYLADNSTELKDNILDHLKNRYYEIPSIDYIKNLLKVLKKNECHSFDELELCARINISDYGVLNQLGDRGRQGVTFKLFGESLDQPRALKVIDPDNVNPKEAKILAKLEDKELENVVRIYDAGEGIATFIGSKGNETRYCIMMEYVDGKTLGEIVSETRLSHSDVLDYSSQTFNGILSLRSRGITHRDLGWNNIKVNTKGIVKILDFGIATDEQFPVQQGNRWRGAPQGKASLGLDVIALGLIMYDMFADKNLITDEKGEKIPNSTYLNRLADIKKDLYDENGMLKDGYSQRIDKNVPQEYKGIVFACMEHYEDLDFIKEKFIEAKPDLKYRFMSKEELIKRVAELEDGKR